jgi:methyl-accepting chemotaxis protein
MSENAPVNLSSDTSATVSFATRPRVSLQHKLLLLTVLMTVSPTLICVYWLNGLTRNVMNQHHARNVQMMATALADQLAHEGRIPDDKVIASRLSGFNLDQRLSFVIITDPTQHLRYRKAIRAMEWMDYQQWMDASSESLMIPISQPVMLGRLGEMAVSRVPIWYRPDLPKEAEDKGGLKGPRQLLGYLTIAISDRTLPQTLGYLRSIQISAALLVCVIVLPLVLLAVRTQIKPLIQLIDASISMAQGHYPKLEDVQRSDEIGLLTRAFNLMLNRVKAHQDIQDRLHEQLEHKVVERTHDLERLNHQLAQTVKQFESLAATDSLTGLANRREIGKTLKRCFLKAEHYNQRHTRPPDG